MAEEQEVRMVLRFDEPSMRREAEKASSRINAPIAAGGAIGAAAGAGTAGGAPSPQAGGAMVGAITQYMRSPEEAIREAARRATIAGAYAIPGAGLQAGPAAEKAWEVQRAASEAGASALSRYAGYNADMARLAAELQVTRIKHDIFMAGTVGGQALAKMYVTEQKALMSAAEVPGAIQKAVMDSAEGSARARVQAEQVGLHVPPSLPKGPEDRVSGDPAHGNAPTPNPERAVTPSPTPTADEEPAVRVNAEEMLRNVIARAKASIPAPSPGVNDETRLLLTAYMGREIGGIL